MKKAGKSPKTNNTTKKLRVWRGLLLRGFRSYALAAAPRHLGLFFRDRLAVGGVLVCRRLLLLARALGFGGLRVLLAGFLLSFGCALFAGLLLRGLFAGGGGISVVRRLSLLDGLLTRSSLLLCLGLFLLFFLFLGLFLLFLLGRVVVAGGVVLLSSFLLLWRSLGFGWLLRLRLRAVLF